MGALDWPHQGHHARDRPRADMGRPHRPGGGGPGRGKGVCGQCIRSESAPRELALMTGFQEVNGGRPNGQVSQPSLRLQGTSTGSPQLRFSKPGPRPRGPSSPLRLTLCLLLAPPCPDNPTRQHWREAQVHWGAVSAVQPALTAAAGACRRWNLQRVQVLCTGGASLSPASASSVLLGAVAAPLGLEHRGNSSAASQLP